MAVIIRTPSADGLLIGTWDIPVVWDVVNDYPDSSDSWVTMGTAASSAGFEYVTTGNLVPSGSTINQIRLRYVIRKTGTQNSNIGAAIWNESNAVAFTDNHNPSTTTTTRTGTWTTNPWTTSAWQVDEVNRIGTNRINFFGIRSTDSNPTIEFYSTQLEIDYDPPAVATGRSFGFIIG
jgi:hypothetical protein